MRGKVLILCGVFLFLCLISSGYQAKAEEKMPELIYVFDAVVKPSMADEYEAIAKEMLGVYSKYGWPYKFYTYSTEDFHYYFVYPVKDLADVEKAWQTWYGIVEKMGAAKWDELSKRMGKTYKYERAAMYRYRADLSYVPENPMVKMEEAPYTYWGGCYLIPGMEKEMEENFKKFVEIFSKHKIDSGWETWVGETGTDMPFYFYVERGKSAGDFWSHSDKVTEKIGGEITSLWRKTQALMRKYEYKTGMFRPDLSYMPEK